MKFTNGMIEHAPHIHIAKPIALPGSLSVLGVFLSLNSFARVFDIADTTKKLQTNVNTGTSNSQTKPGCIVLEGGEHLLSIPDRYAMKAMPTASTPMNRIPAAIRMIVVVSTGPSKDYLRFEAS